MNQFRGFLVASAVVLCGCGPNTLIPVGSAGLTAEEVAAEIRPLLDPMRSLLVTTPGTAGGGNAVQGSPCGLTNEAKRQVLAALSAAREEHKGNEAGREALDLVTHDIEDMIREAWDRECWSFVLAAIEAYRTLNPGNAEMDRLEKLTAIEAQRPKIEIQGFFGDHEKDDIYVFLRVTDPKSRQAYYVQARANDEFHGMRLVDIIGVNKGVGLEYLAIPGSRYEVWAP